MSQPKLAAAVGLSQSNIGTLEVTGDGSSKTASIAHACGVRALWLEKGEGPMLGPENEVEAAQHIAAEALGTYRAPNNSRDFRTIAFTLADDLKHSGVELPVDKFLALADNLYKKLGDGK